MSLQSERAAVIEVLFRENWEPLYRCANRMLRSPPLAEEAVQEAFMFAVMKYEEMQSSGNPVGWLYQTLRYVVLNQQRARRRGTELIVRLLSEQDAQHTDEGLFADLTEDEDFRLVRRVTLEGYSIRETAQQLGISVEACKKRVQRAKARLRERLK